MQDEKRENRTEPQEVVSWYVRPEGQEVVDCYVQPRPLPSGAAPQTPREPEKRSLSLIHISEPTRRADRSRMPSSA